MTDVCLINPNGRIPAPNAACEPPLWLGLIAGYCMSIGESVAIVDAEAEGLTVKETVKRVKDINASKQDIIVVMGANPSVSSTPKWPVTEDLLKYLDADVTGIHPIAIGKTMFIRTPFTGCPNIPWHLLPMDKYRAHNWHCLDDLDKRSPYAVLYTSLNCPFDCTYCPIHTLYGDRVVRFRRMHDIKKDLTYFASRNIRNIKIWDELFCLKEHRVEEICDHIIDNRYDFNIWAYARVDTVTPRMLEKMKKAGINWLAYGFEAAEITIRERAHKGFANRESKRAIDMTRDAGINIMGNFIFGLPGETESSMQASLDMAVKENFEYVNFYVALPYPGSQWYAELKDKPTDWRKFSQYAPDMYGDPKVIKFKDEAFQTYFRRPEYHSMIVRKFGQKASDHIKEMLKWRIRE